MKKNKLIAFTLVELIITITILIILTSISYFYLTSSIKDAKDRTRIADLNSIKKVLSIYKVKNWIYPYVSNSKIEEIDWKKWIVWVFGEETFRETKMLNSIPVDPDSGKYYKYMLSEDKSKFILEANLNNDSLFTLDESLNNNKNINDSDGSSGDNNDNVENPDIPPQYIPPAPWPETNIDCFTFRSTT